MKFSTTSAPPKCKIEKVGSLLFTPPEAGRRGVEDVRGSTQDGEMGPGKVWQTGATGKREVWGLQHDFQSVVLRPVAGLSLGPRNAHSQAPPQLDREPAKAEFKSLGVGPANCVLANSVILPHAQV